MHNFDSYFVSLYLFVSLISANFAHIYENLYNNSVFLFVSTINKKEMNKFYLLFLLCVGSIVSAEAKRDTTMHKSEVDALSIGAYVFSNQSFNENLDNNVHHKFGLSRNSPSMGGSLVLAKEFNPIFGWRGSLGYNCNKGRASFFTDPRKAYTFHDIEGFGDLTIDITDIIFKDRDFTALDLKIFGGVGALGTFGYTRDSLTSTKAGVDYDSGTRANYGFRGGVNASWNITRHIRLAAEACMNVLDDHFNGVAGGFPFDGRLNIGGGIIYTPKPNLKLKKKFRVDPLMPDTRMELVNPNVNPLVVYITPEPEGEKIRRVDGRANVAYRVNSAVLDQKYMNNSAELKKIRKSIEEVKEDNTLVITSIRLHSYCSPEGAYDYNRVLARKRADAVKDYLKKKYKFKDIDIKVVATPENWRGLIRALEKSDFENKKELLEIAKNDSYSDDDRENQLMIAAGNDAKKLKEYIYPYLRNTLYFVKFKVRDFSLDEARTLIGFHADKLSEREMFDVAFSYPRESVGFISALQAAVKYNANDPVANLNLANAYIERMNITEAKRYLDAAEQLPEAIHARGIVAALEGDFETAEELLKQAGELGIKESSEVLVPYKRAKKVESVEPAETETTPAVTE